MWKNVKKIDFTVKREGVPLQSKEVLVIRRKCVLLEVRSALCSEPNDFSFFVLITSWWQASLN